METMDKKIKHARVRGYGFNGIDGKKFNNDTNWQEGIGYIQRLRAGAPPRRLDHKAFPSLFSPSFSSFLCVQRVYADKKTSLIKNVTRVKVYVLIRASVTYSFLVYDSI